VLSQAGQTVYLQDTEIAFLIKTQIHTGAVTATQRIECLNRNFLRLFCQIIVNRGRAKDVDFSAGLTFVPYIL
jgi:hypothetical protein